MTASHIVAALLETSAILDPLADERAWRWRHQQHPWGPYRQGNAVTHAVNQLTRDLDASGRSLEGEPDAAQQARDKATLHPYKDPNAGMFRNSATMSRNRNARRKSFGASDYRYSLADRGWPTAYRRPDGKLRKKRTPPEMPVDEPQI